MSKPSTSDPFADRDGFKVDPGHSPGCYLVESGRHEYIVYGGWESRKRNGHRGGSTWFHRFKCNDAGCEARLLVRWDVLMEFFSPGSVAAR